jgi:hypothetical protein
VASACPFCARHNAGLVRRGVVALGAALVVSCADAAPQADPVGDAGVSSDGAASDGQLADAASVVPMYGASGCDLSGGAAGPNAGIAVVAAAAFLGRMRRRTRKR